MKNKEKVDILGERENEQGRKRERKRDIFVAFPCSNLVVLTYIGKQIFFGIYCLKNRTPNKMVMLEIAEKRRA